MGLGHTAIPEARAALEAFLTAAARADRVTISDITPLAGGTVHENWLLKVDIRGGAEQGVKTLVLRTDQALNLAGSLSRREEFEVIKAVYDVGTAVPEPLWSSDSSGPLGQEFFIMRFRPGTAAANDIVHDESLGGAHECLAQRLGEELARLQTITPESGKLSFLHAPPEGAARHIITALRDYLDSLAGPHPAIEWGLRWLELNAPPPGDLVLTHGDFRTGNYLVDNAGLTAILDWERAGWGDPLEDLGWFFLKFWRLDQTNKTAGGIASRGAVVRGYERVSGRKVHSDEMAYWEIMANVRWAVVSIQQAARHLSGLDRSLELCLTGCRTVEMEYEALRLIRAEANRKADA